MKLACSTWKSLLLIAVASSGLVGAPQRLADEEEDTDPPEDVIGFYIGFSTLARAGQLRNGAPELQGMALNEDYQ